MIQDFIFILYINYIFSLSFYYVRNLEHGKIICIIICLIKKLMNSENIYFFLQKFYFAEIVASLELFWWNLTIYGLDRFA